MRSLPALPAREVFHHRSAIERELGRVKIQEKTKVGEYLVADLIGAVVALAQMGIV